ncbi:MAG: hypothetical protein M9904_10460 [Chitinophagaceae bacterium]|nr:hypothetical protein [Chitinophagaceae bacterium]
MKERVLSGWNWIRVIYLITGVTIIIQSATNGQWLGVALGGYFSAMALFRFGCAAGSCFGGSCTIENSNKPGDKD